MHALVRAHPHTHARTHAHRENERESRTELARVIQAKDIQKLQRGMKETDGEKDVGHVVLVNVHGLGLQILNSGGQQTRGSS